MCAIRGALSSCQLIISLTRIITPEIRVICSCVSCGSLITAGSILHMHPVNGRWHYHVMSSLIGWAHTQNDPCRRMIIMYIYIYIYVSHFISTYQGQKAELKNIRKNSDSRNIMQSTTYLINSEKYPVFSYFWSVNPKKNKGNEPGICSAIMDWLLWIFWKKLTLS